MNLLATYQFLGGLLTTGVSPAAPVVWISNGHPREIDEVRALHGPYEGEPFLATSASTARTGDMIALVPVGEDASDLLKAGTHKTLPGLEEPEFRRDFRNHVQAPAEFRSQLPERLRALAQADGRKGRADVRSALQDAAAEIEGGEEAYAALVEESRKLREKLARTERNLHATLALVQRSAP